MSRFICKWLQAHQFSWVPPMPPSVPTATFNCMKNKDYQRFHLTLQGNVLTHPEHVQSPDQDIKNKYGRHYPLQIRSLSESFKLNISETITKLEEMAASLWEPSVHLLLNAQAACSTFGGHRGSTCRGTSILHQYCNPEREVRLRSTPSMFLIESWKPERANNIVPVVLGCKSDGRLRSCSNICPLRTEGKSKTFAPIRSRFQIVCCRFFF